MTFITTATGMRLDGPNSKVTRKKDLPNALFSCDMRTARRRLHKMRGLGVAGYVGISNGACTDVAMKS